MTQAKQSIKGCVAITLVLGILWGSVWASRQGNVFGVGLPPSFDQVSMVLTLVVLAAALSRHTPTSRQLLFSAALFFCGHLVAILLTATLTDPGELMALSVISACFGGVALALMEYLLFMTIARLELRRFAVVVSAALLVANVYDSFFLGAGTSVATVQWVIGSLVCLAYLFWLDIRLRRTQADNAGIEPTEPEAMPRVRCSISAQIAPTLAGIALLMLVQGYMAHLTGLGGAGTNAVFSIATEILMVGVRVMAIIGVIVLGESLAGPALIGGTGALWMFGILFVLASAAADGAIESAGMTIIECAMYLLQAFALVFVSRETHKAEGIASNQLICLGLAAVFANQITRNLPLLAVPNAIPDAGVLAWSTFWCAIIVLFVVLLELFATHTASNDSAPLRACAPNPKASNSPASVGTSAEPASNVALGDLIEQREHDFAQNFRAFCTAYNLTDREIEVLFYGLHGNTIATTAQRLGVSQETVKTYQSRIYRRCGVGGRQEVLALVENFSARESLPL